MISSKIGTSHFTMSEISTSFLSFPDSWFFSLVRSMTHKFPRSNGPNLHSATSLSLGPCLHFWKALSLLIFLANVMVNPLSLLIFWLHSDSERVSILWTSRAFILHFSQSYVHPAELVDNNSRCYHLFFPVFHHCCQYAIVFVVLSINDKHTLSVNMWTKQTLDVTVMPFLKKV